MLTRDERGFSLIELMVVLVIAAILLGVATPALSEWIARARMRSVAEALQNALRNAQTEAVRQNRRVVFALTNTSPPVLDASAAANGKYWLTQALKAGAETANILIAADTTAAASGTSGTGPAAICFTSLGRLTTTAAASTGVGAACTVPADAATPFAYDVSIGTYSALRVQVFLGGKVRMCDAAKTLSATNPDGC